DHQRNRVVGEAGAVLDAVDARVEQTRQRILAEHVRGDARALRVRGGDRVDEHRVGPQRREIAYATVDPVAHQLDPAVAEAPLFPPRHGQLRLVLDVDGQPG